MTLPGSSISVLDGALGIQAPSIAGTQVKIGCALGGSRNVLYSFSSAAMAKATLLGGPAYEAVCEALRVAGGPVLVMPVPFNAVGNVGSVTHVGTGAMTCTVSMAPWSQIVITITKTGNLGAGEFTYSVGGGSTSAVIVIPAGGTYLIPGTFTTITFTSMSFTATDVYIVATSGAITKGGSTSTDISQVSSPVDDYQVTVEVMTAGALATSQFRYSLDALAGSADAVKSGYSPTITTVGSGVYVIVGTGLVLTFAGTAVKGDTYDFKSVAPAPSTTEFNAAFTALLADSREWSLLHVIGCSTQNAAGAAAMAAAVEAKMALLGPAFRYARAVVECPVSGSVMNNAGSIAINSEADSATISAFASTASSQGLTSVCAGDVLLPSDSSQTSLAGGYRRRNLAWAYMARLSKIAVSKHPGKVRADSDGGALSGVKYIWRDEAATEALDAQRFVTCRTFRGKAGYFVTRGRTLAAVTSDYTQIMNCRVMDVACRATYLAELDYINDDVRVSTTTGYIDPRDADRIEKAISASVRDALAIGTPAPDASSVSVVLDRTSNILSTSNEGVEIRVLPKGYLEYLTTRIGFINPARS